jgi:hypothetical protein
MAYTPTSGNEPEIAMHENIEFVHDWFAEVETVPGRLKQVAFPSGTRLRGEVRRIGKLADVCLADGTIARRIPLKHLVVVQKPMRLAA